MLVKRVRIVREQTRVELALIASRRASTCTCGPPGNTVEKVLADGSSRSAIVSAGTQPWHKRTQSPTERNNHNTNAGCAARIGV